MKVSYISACTVTESSSKLASGNILRYLKLEDSSPQVLDQLASNQLSGKIGRGIMDNNFLQGI
jgi:hypothetical protein